MHFGQKLKIPISAKHIIIGKGILGTHYHNNAFPIAYLQYTACSLRAVCEAWLETLTIAPPAPRSTIPFATYCTTHIITPVHSIEIYLNIIYQVDFIN